MDQNNTTDGPEVLKESVADVALKTYTLYFLVTSIILGLLLLASLRKAAKICCWRYMYGSKYTRNEKEDPRVPATLFRTPSILTTLQDHYDKGRSLRSTAKSEATSRSYVSAQDIEYAIGEGSPRVHRYLDPESDKGDGEGADTMEVTDEISGTEMAGGDVKGSTGRPESDDEVRNVDETDSETDGSKTGNDEKESGHNESGENDRGTEAAEEQTGSDDEQCADVSSKDGTDDHTKYEPESGEIIARSEDTQESGNTEDTDDDDSEKEDTPPKNDPSSYVSEIVLEEDTVTCARSDHGIELQEMADPDSFIIGRQPSVSEESASSTVNDIAPLVTRPTPPASVSGRHGRYKKNTGQKSTSGSSARSTSAKLSKRVKQT